MEQRQLWWREMKAWRPQARLQAWLSSPCFPWWTGSGWLTCQPSWKSWRHLSSWLTRPPFFHRIWRIAKLLRGAHKRRPSSVAVNCQYQYQIDHLVGRLTSWAYLKCSLESQKRCFQIFLSLWQNMIFQCMETKLYDKCKLNQTTHFSQPSTV